MYIYRCENSTDGIFSGIYQIYQDKVNRQDTKLEITGERSLELFAQYREVRTDREQGEKVAATLRRRLHPRDYEHLYHATLSKDGEKAESIFKMVTLAFDQPYRPPITDCLQNPVIAHIVQMSRNVGREGQRYLEFLRFRELEGGLLFSEIHPENQIISLIGDHYSDRFPMEDFLIYDSTHGISLVHRKGYPWFLSEISLADREKINRLSEEEPQWQALWKSFHQHIAIPERYNPKLQQQLLPLKFREFMTEYQK